MLAAVAEGTTQLRNFSTGADCASTLAALTSLGVKVDGGNHTEVHIEGGTWRAATSALDCGNSGSTIRMLCGMLAGQPFTTELTGDESLSRRPMARVIDPLLKMGASIE